MENLSAAEAAKRLESFSFVRKNYGKTNHFLACIPFIFVFLLCSEYTEIDSEIQIQMYLACVFVCIS